MMTVQERINNVRQFLAEHNATPEAAEIMPIEMSSSPFLNELKNLKVELKQLNYYQDLARVRYEKDNAVAGDINVHDWNEASVPSGFAVTFTFVIPEGWVLHIRECSITYAANTVYNFVRDGIYEPLMSEFFMDYANHYKIFSPPLRAYGSCIIEAINLSAQTNVYSVYFSGFLRRYKRTTEIMTEETSLIEKSAGEI